MSISNPDDLGFSLTPPLPGTLNPDLALNAALAPVISSPDADPIPLGRGWAFDFLMNEFVPNGLSPANVYEVDQIRVWIEKALRTARYAHPIYGNEFGMLDPFAIIGQPYTPELVGDLEAQIIDTLTVHDRISSVSDFFFEQDPATDALYVTFTVVLDDDDQDPVQVDSLQIGGTS